MKLARTALGNHVDHRAAVAAVLGLISIQQDFYFFHRVGARRSGVSGGGAVVLPLHAIHTDRHGGVADAAHVGQCGADADAVDGLKIARRRTDAGQQA